MFCESQATCLVYQRFQRSAANGTLVAQYKPLTMMIFPKRNIPKEALCTCYVIQKILGGAC